MNRGKISGAMLLALLSTTAAMPAYAQTAGAEDRASGDNDEIIVTTNRRAEDSQDVSGVVQALGAEQLRQDGISELRQLQVAIPGLSIANQEGNVEIFIRGVGSANNTELGDPGAAPHLNGTYIPRPRGLGLMFYDLDRVEVNKGPQGTLYGRNALAGTLNIITAKPRLGEFSGYAQAEIANRSSYGAEGAINIPLGETLALRAAGYYINRDYGFKNVSTGAEARDLKPAGLEENYAGRLSLLWEPSDRLSVSIVGDYGKETGTGYPGANIFSAVVGSGLRPDKLNLKHVVYRGLQGDMENELWGIQGKINYDFGTFGAELTGSYRSVDFYQVNASSDGIDYPGRDLSAVQYDNYSGNFWQTRSKSQVYEARLFANDDQRFRWNLGAFYFKEDQAVGYLALADRGFCCYSATEFVMPDVKGESYAFYVDGTYDVADRLRFLAGIRYTDERKSRYGIGGNWALTLGGENFDCCFATRIGTEGFRPALLDRLNFDVSNITTPQGMAQFLIEGVKTPGLRDTLIAQIGAIADGTNPNGTCIDRPDIDNGFVNCPTLNPSDRNGGFSYANFTIPGQQIGSSKFNYVDWRAGIEYDLSDDNMLYAKVSTGHKSGGFNDSFDGSPIPETFSPEKLLVYEIGSRNSFDMFGRRGVFNLTGFYYDYTNQVFQDLTCINLDTTQQPPVCNGYSLVNRNIGASRIYGAEAEMRLRFPGNFGLDINAAYLDTKITRGIVADARAQDFGAGGNSPLISLVGNRLPLASKMNVSARLSQWFDAGPGRLDWQALLNYRSSYYLSQFNEADIVFLDGTRQTAFAAGFPDRQQGYVTLNLGIGYTIDNFRIEAWASNFLNEEVSQKALVGSSLNIRFLNDARTYGLRVRVNF
ncbi:TonB-dependent receptor [Sphingopyxis terrae]|uniref:Iron complex outermembrane recepter protein n=1 Tax=Sphingopyxis terrae subsp. ummariensis TaxID=429001 RepID=A0A1Y6EFY6_9SPHN|nr:TonB-dependent receptor [Sphingopyxis terrae]SMQ59073.1 iron complex outermembrane recepter protein [Sphingopyxis terrae subsp. ummariensis]